MQIPSSASSGLDPRVCPLLPLAITCPRWMIRSCGDSRVFPSLMLSLLHGYSLLKIYVLRMRCIHIFFGLTNVVGTLNMLGLAKRVGARFLLTSTSEVYGDPLQHPQAETYWGNVNPIGVRSCYDEGKRTAETLTMDYHRGAGIEVRIARIFNIYGPRMCIDDGRVVSNFVAQAWRKEPLTVYGDGKQTRSFQYVSDLGPRGSREYLGRGPPPGSGRCFNCGMDGHWARDCKAGDWKNKCYHCGERGHIERNCKSSPKKLRHEQSYSRSPVRSRSYTELLGHFALVSGSYQSYPLILNPYWNLSSNCDYVILKQNR